MGVRRHGGTRLGLELTVMMSAYVLWLTTFAYKIAEAAGIGR